MAAIELFQAAAFKQLQDQERRRRGLIEFMDDADAGMIQRRSSAGLAPETLQRKVAVAGGGCVSSICEELDGDMAAKLLVDPS
jgi:hypothetical protein